MPAELERAVITSNGKLTPDFEYIAQLREENEQKSMATKKRQEQHAEQEFEISNSVMNKNVKKVEDIQGEALDFSQ